MSSELMRYLINLRRLAGLLLCGVLIALPLLARAELVVVVNPQSGIDALSRTEVINMFLGHDREMKNGLLAMPIDLPASTPEKASFYRILVNRDLNQMAAYWSRFVFSGSTTPPLQAANVQELVSLVSGNRRAIGYMDRRNVDSRVKVVLVLD